MQVVSVGLCHREARYAYDRADYEVDFINYFTKLQDLGVTRVPQAYLVDMEVAGLRL